MGAQTSWLEESQTLKSVPPYQFQYLPFQYAGTYSTSCSETVQNSNPIYCIESDIASPLSSVIQAMLVYSCQLTNLAEHTMQTMSVKFKIIRLLVIKPTRIKITYFKVFL